MRFPICLIAVLGTLVGLAADGPSARAATAGYWRFEEGTAGSAASGSGTILDSSGNGNNGTPLNGPTYSSNVPVSMIPQTGASNKLSMSFNGTNQRIFIPDSSSLAITGSVTLEAYIDPSTIPGMGQAEQIVFRGDDLTGRDPYQLDLVNGALNFAVQDASDNTGDVNVPFSATNQWTFVAGTLDASTGVMKLYENGNLVATNTTTIRPYGPLNPSENPGLGIGNVQSSNYNEYFNGQIDEVRISNAALTPSQFLDAPEPSSATILAAGLTGLAARRRRI